MKVAYSGDELEIRRYADGLGRLLVSEVHTPRSEVDWKHALSLCEVVLLRDQDVVSDALEGVPPCSERPFEQVIVYLGQVDAIFQALTQRDSSSRSVVVTATSAQEGLRVACAVRRAWCKWSDEIEGREADGARTRWLIDVTREHSIVSVASADGTITYVNRKFAELSGYSAAELVGANHRLLRSGVHEDTFYEAMWAALAAGRIWQGNLCNRRKDGSLYWVSATIIPELGEMGTPVRYFAALTDITMAKIAEAEMLHAREVADRANMAKSEFLSSMSHELRTPLNAVIGFGQLLREDEPIKDSPRLSMWVDQICKGGEHLLALINQVLDLARVEAGKVPLSMESVDIGKVIAESVSLVRGVAEKSGVSIFVRAGEEEDPVFAEADHTRIKQVLLNLLSNAVKYNQKGGRVFVSYGHQDGGVRVSVRDTGMGISEAQRDKLFVPFERLSVQASHIEGFGIGLALSRKLAEAMGGGLTYEPVIEPDPRGSLFCVKLNASAPKQQELRAEEALTQMDGLSEGCRYLLYIEDNPSNVLLMREIMKRFQNVELECAGTAEQGLLMTMTRCPDLIIMDFNLPGMSGLDALKLLRESEATRHVPVLCLTADVMRAHVRRNAVLEFDDFMVKPVKVREIRRALERLLKTGLKPIE